jgi:Ribbon-helix-helix protein, copG family
MSVVTARRKPGRPPGWGKYPALLHVRASEEDAARLAHLCRLTQQSRTVVLRRLLRYLAQIEAALAEDQAEAGAVAAPGGDGDAV